MYEISVTGEFTATHQLRYPDGRLEESHGHDWRVTATYVGPNLNEMGVLADFGDVRGPLRALLRTFDGQDLNRLPLLADRNPSAENVARVVAENLPQTLPGGVRLASVGVEEEPGCFARYVR